MPEVATLISRDTVQMRALNNHITSGRLSYQRKVTPAQWLLTLLILRSGRASVSSSCSRAIDKEDEEWEPG
jgi:hypothetical protein